MGAKMSADAESLDQLFKTYTIRWYRCPIDRSTLHDLMQPGDLRGVVQALEAASIGGLAPSDLR